MAAAAAAALVCGAHAYGSGIVSVLPRATALSRIMDMCPRIGRIRGVGDGGDNTGWPV